jgi:hypothetical protein
MKKITKDFTLLEIRMIAETIQYLLSLQMKAGTSYKIAQWGKPFSDKLQSILDRYNTIVLSFCKPGEITVPSDKNELCIKELNEFYNTQDTVEFSLFKLEWVEDLTTNNITILHQFMDEGLFLEDVK